jgi:AcrR family transcriptional regulator
VAPDKASPAPEKGDPDRRLRLTAEQRRAQLIELGRRMLATRSLDELSVEALAEEAGISRGLLFHYFRSKQEFHREVARSAAEDLLARTAPDDDLPPLDRLRAGLSAYIDYVVSNSDGYVSLVRGAASGDEAMREIFDSTRATQAQRVLDSLEQLGLPFGPESVIAIHGWVAFTEEAIIHWLPDRPISRDELLNLLANSLPALTLASGDLRLSEPAAAVGPPPAEI